MSVEGMTEAMRVVADWARALGVRGINELDGCWEQVVDDHWWVALNGHDEPCRCSRGMVVGPFECVITYNGWLAGGFDAYGGSIVAGETGDEDRFIAAVRAATARVQAAAQASANGEG